MKPNRLRCITACALLIFTLPAWADFTGDVTRIIDGDTVEVVTQDHPTTPGKIVAVRIRLADIDAPESGQAYGSLSRQHLANMIFRKIVRVEDKQQDRYERTLGVIYSQHCAPKCVEININMQMVVDGMAWAYRFRGRATDPQMHGLEQDARQARRGLWADPHAQEPWKWRRNTQNERN